MRRSFAHTRSLLMDRATLLAHESQWVRDPNSRTNTSRCCCHTKPRSTRTSSRTPSAPLFAPNRTASRTEPSKRPSAPHSRRRIRARDVCYGCRVARPTRRSTALTGRTPHAGNVRAGRRRVCGVRDPSGRA
ncbi:Wadjet anti-phage system protein JetD domain-containing protein [Amycolatopsis rhizosphaerae]|uniref:Wadjet anti-phage system protein JetD domain-containing protein n=1 Tax=Amycolatopsis rhizosphaerae TaxID=2053003 RepID=UPI003CCC6E79